MANTNLAFGFKFEKRLSNNEMPTIEYKVLEANKDTIKDGDPVVFGAADDVVIGATAGTIVGVVRGDVYAKGSGYAVLVIPALPDVLFRVQDNQATASLGVFGTLIDFAGTTGVMYVASGVSTNDDCVLQGYAGLDNVGKVNAPDEQYREVLVTFNKTVWK